MKTYLTMCTFQGCKRKVFIAGYCNVCESKYCKLHRLPEKHECSTFDEYKERLRSKHKEALKKQQHIKSKLNIIN